MSRIVDGYSPLFWLTGRFIALVVVTVVTLGQLLTTVLRIFSGTNKNFEIQSQGKVVFVTGAASGIGKAVVQGLVQRGCFVFAADVNETQLMMNYQDNDRVQVIHCDVTQEESVANASEIVKKHKIVEEKGLFAIFNAAGIMHKSFGANMLEIDITEYMQVMDVNFFGVVRVNNALFPLVKRFAECARCPQQRPVVVNVTSISGVSSAKYFGPYSATKSSLVRYTEMLSEELGSHGIRALNIIPGLVDTPMSFNQSKRAYQQSKDAGKFMEFLENFAMPPSAVASRAISAMFNGDVFGEIYIDKWPLALGINAVSGMPHKTVQRIRNAGIF